MADSYSLWLKVPGQIGDKLSREIASQAAEYNAPLFEPHVTLLGGIGGDQDTVLQASRELAGQIQVKYLPAVTAVPTDSTSSDATYGTYCAKCYFCLSPTAGSCCHTAASMWQAKAIDHSLHDRLQNAGKRQVYLNIY